MLREKCPSGVTLLGPTIGRFFQRYVGGVHIHSGGLLFYPSQIRRALCGVENSYNMQGWVDFAVRSGIIPHSFDSEHCVCLLPPRGRCCVCSQFFGGPVACFFYAIGFGDNEHPSGKNVDK